MTIPDLSCLQDIFGTPEPFPVDTAYTDPEAYFDDPYSPPPNPWDDLDPWYDAPLPGLRKPRWAPPPKWWRDLDEQGIREEVGHYGEQAEAIFAVRLAGGETSPLQKLVESLHKRYERSQTDFGAWAQEYLARFLTRLRPGTEYCEMYRGLYSYVLDRWALRYVCRKLISRMQRESRWSAVVFWPARTDGELSRYKPDGAWCGRAIHGTDEEREWWAGDRKPERMPDHTPSRHREVDGESPDLAHDRQAVEEFCRTLPKRWAEIARLASHGMKKAKIARHVGMSRKGVEKALRSMRPRARKFFGENLKSRYPLFRLAGC
jgi:hypothetical protein